LFFFCTRPPQKKPSWPPPGPPGRRPPEAPALFFPAPPPRPPKNPGNRLAQTRPPGAQLKKRRPPPAPRCLFFLARDWGAGPPCPRGPRPPPGARGVGHNGPPFFPPAPPVAFSKRAPRPGTGGVPAKKSPLRSPARGPPPRAPPGPPPKPDPCTGFPRPGRKNRWEIAPGPPPGPPQTEPGVPVPPHPRGAPSHAG